MSKSQVKVIRHPSSGINIQDDPSLPFKIEVNLRPPDFMNVTFVMLYGGSDEVLARASDRSAVDGFLDKHELRDHPRLRWIRITGPNGAIEEIGR